MERLLLYINNVTRIMLLSLEEGNIPIKGKSKRIYHYDLIKIFSCNTNMILERHSMRFLVWDLFYHLVYKHNRRLISCYSQQGNLLYISHNCVIKRNWSFNEYAFQCGCVEPTKFFKKSFPCNVINEKAFNMCKFHDAEVRVLNEEFCFAACNNRWIPKF